jgi:transcriptional regulator with XRE-family HTH domain
MTQGELAQASGIGRVTIARLEIGQSEARPSTTRALARALGVKPAVLMAEGERDGDAG